MTRSASISRDELKGQAARAGVVTVTAQAVRFAITTSSTVILARLLSPADYGVVAMVTSVFGFMRILSDAGLSTAILQREKVSQELLSTVFWANLALGTAMAIVAAASAPVLVFTFGDPRILWICFALATTFVIDALAAQHQSQLRRHMCFKALAIVDILAVIASSIVGIWMAWRGFQYWSLVGMQIASVMVTAMGVSVAYPWLPGRPRRGTGAHGLVRFGAFLTGTNVLNYLFRNVDNLLIGWRWGAGPVGLYQKAYGLLMLPIHQVNAPISQVAVATLSRMQSDTERLRRYFVGGYSIATSITIPVVVFSFIFAEEIILVLLGDKWAASVRLFQLLAPAALVSAVLNPFGWLFISTGRTDRQFRIGILWSSLIILSFVVGVWFGAKGVAIGYSAMSLVLAWPICSYAIAGTSVSVRDVGRALGYPALSILVAGCIGLWVKFLLPESMPATARAIIGCGALFGAYAFLLLVVFRQWASYRELIQLVWPGWKARG